jgi:hypothetical protein
LAKNVELLPVEAKEEEESVVFRHLVVLMGRRSVLHYLLTATGELTRPSNVPVALSPSLSSSLNLGRKRLSAPSVKAGSRRMGGK